MVAGGAAPSPYSKMLDPHRLPRIQAVGSEVSRWLDYFDRHPQERYVSDGDPATITIPQGQAHLVRPAAGMRVLER